MLSALIWEFWVTCKYLYLQDVRTDTVINLENVFVRKDILVNYVIFQSVETDVIHWMVTASKIHLNSNNLAIIEFAKQILHIRSS